MYLGTHLMYKSNNSKVENVQEIQKQISDINIQTTLQ